MNYIVRSASQEELIEICSKIPTLVGVKNAINANDKNVKYFIIQYSTYELAFSLEHKGYGYEAHIAVIKEHRKVARQLAQLACEWVFTEYDTKAKYIYVTLDESTKFGKMLANFTRKCGFIKFNSIYIMPNRRLS